MSNKGLKMPPEHWQQGEQANEQAIRVYWWLLRYYAEHGYAPSVREMMAAMAFSSTSVIDYYLNILIQWGWIERAERGVRNLRPIRATERGLSAEQIARLYGWEQVALNPAEAMAMAKAAKNRRKKKARLEKTFKSVREQIRPFGG